MVRDVSDSEQPVYPPSTHASLKIYSRISLGQEVRPVGCRRGQWKLGRGAVCAHKPGVPGSARRWRFELKDFRDP